MTNYVAIRDGGKTNEEGAQRLLKKLISTDGVLSDSENKATQHSPSANMSVDVSIGDIVITYLNYFFHAWATTLNVVTITANSSGNPRKDAVVAWIDLSVVSSALSNNPGAYKVTAVPGTPAGTPVVPTDPEIQAAIGAGNPFERVANVDVANGAASITNANITDTRGVLSLIYDSFKLVQRSTSAPTPSASQIVIYGKSDGKVYKKLPDGTESEIGSGGGGGNSFVYHETPSGSVNGSNTLFTSSASYIAGTLEVHKNGVFMDPAGNDYTETSPASGTFTFVTAPTTGTKIRIKYQISGATSTNSDTVDLLHANATPTANNLIPLDSRGNFPIEVVREFLYSNAIINAGMTVNQRQGTPNASTTYQYVLDRWAGRVGGTYGAGTMGQITTANIGVSGYAFGFSGITLTGSGEIRLRYRMEAKDAVKFKSAPASFGIKVYHDVGSSVNYTIYIRKPTTTADDFSAVTDIANSGAIAVATATASTIRFSNINSGNIGDVSKGIEIEVVAACGAVTTKNFQFADAVFAYGRVEPDFQPQHFTNTLEECARYYTKTYEYGTAPGAATDVGCYMGIGNGSLNRPMFGVRYKREMRVAPTVVLYSSVTGATGKARDESAGTDINALTYKPGAGGCVLYASATPANSNGIIFQFAADAEL